MRYYLDTEFIEDGKTIDLISIALVCADGRELYRCNSECDLSKASDWVKNNVIPHLPETKLVWVSRKEMAHQVKTFCSRGHSKPEFWAYYADYDWVAFCQLFGRMIDLPEGWPKYCLDLKQYALSLGDPKLPEQDAQKAHDALADARWNQRVHVFLMNREADLQ